MTLDRYLKAHNIKQGEFARRLGVHRLTVARWLAGDVPQLRRLLAIQAATGGLVTALDWQRPAPGEAA